MSLNHNNSSPSNHRASATRVASSSNIGVALRLALALTASVVPQAIDARAASLDREQFLMGTRLHMHLRGPDPGTLELAAEDAFREVDRLEDVFSSWRADSELSRLNRSAAEEPQGVSDDLLQILESATELSTRTAGAFDVTVEPLLRAYDLRGAGRRPPADELAAALAAVDPQHITIEAEPHTVAFTHARAAVNLGGIAKGYALDQVDAILRAHGVTSALIDFGGQILALGEPAPGEPWVVDVAHPDDRHRPAVRLELRDASVATSAQSERTLTVDGAPLGHIIHPLTGEPVPGWGSATAVSSSATRADALATAFFVMGPESARRLADSLDDVTAVLLETSTVPSRAETANAARFAPLPAPRLTVAGRAPGLASVFPAAASPSPPDLLAQAGSGEVPPSNAELARRIDILAAELEDAKLGEIAEAPRSVHGLGPAASKVYGIDRGVSIGGYGEMLYEGFAENREDDAPAETTSQLDFLRAIVYVGYKFNDRILFNSEIEFEHASTDRSGSASVELAYLDFLTHRSANVRGGLLLVPSGFINELHEPPIFLGARRPDVEQVIIPTTWRANGAGVFGEPAAGLSYRAYLMESLDGSEFTASGIRGGRQKGSKAKVEDLAIAARGDFESELGFLVGGSVFSGGTAQGLVDTLGNGFDARTTVFEAHGQFRRHGLQARALYAQVDVDEADKLNVANGLEGARGVGERLVGWYLEGGVDLLHFAAPGSERALTPFVRYEAYNTQDKAPPGFAASPENDRTVVTFGASFHPHPQVVIKGDYQVRRNEARTGVDQFNLALGFLY